MMMGDTTMYRNYMKLSILDTFAERFDYLKLKNIVGKSMFGGMRYLNQNFYHSRDWKRVRDEVIVRDEGYDLGCPGYYISGKIIVHHMNPVSIEDLEHGNFEILNPKLLISVSESTHRAIHYGYEKIIPRLSNERVQGDTKLW